jgi:hypothetical protein
MNDLINPRPAPAGNPEVGMLARELVAAYRQGVARHKHELGLSTAEAMAKAEEPCPLGQALNIVARPPEAVTWSDLEELGRYSPQRALDLWEEIKQAAREELRSGRRAAAALEGSRCLPWQRAEFLALRQELADGLQPRSGIERQLIDQLAQAQLSLFVWHQRLCAAVDGGDTGEVPGAMVERFHKMLVRTMRALQDWRKAPLAVVVQNAGQVNVAGQQVNTRNGDGHPKGKARRRGRSGPCTCPADRRPLVGNRANGQPPPALPHGRQGPPQR